MNVLIQSITGDASTDEVISWVRYLAPQHHVIRLDNAVKMQKIRYRLHHTGKRLQCTTQAGTVLDNETLVARWYRRGGLYTDCSPLPVATTDERSMAWAVSRHVATECRYIEESIDAFLCSGTHINRYTDNATNKLNNLAQAIEAGLSIPDTLVTNEVNALRFFLGQHKRIVTKCIAANDFIINMQTHRVHIGLNTVLLEQDSPLPEEDTAMPALYQQYIDKLYELRIFYLNGTLYPMAIFSQANDKTRIDFRNYDAQRPNRCVPYSLPKDIEQRLRSLMQQLGMNCGSVDMIVTPDRDYVFLEVNPVGQFQWLSRNCNYGLERRLAQELCFVTP